MHAPKLAQNSTPRSGRAIGATAAALTVFAALGGATLASTPSDPPADTATSDTATSDTAMSDGTMLDSTTPETTTIETTTTESTTADSTAAAVPGAMSLVDALRSLDRSTEWELVDTIPLGFPTHHPQGLAIVGDRLFVSSVEILEPTERFDEPVDGYDRSPGAGAGHVFVLTRDGELLDDVEVGEGDIYHPGGIDFDGTDVWVPVAEYRPDSAAIVYRLDPESLAVTEAFRYPDHVGGVVRDPDSGLVHGVTWGSRRLVTWTGTGSPLAAVANPSHLIDWQDCQFVGDGMQLCSGVTGLATTEDDVSYELGGMALIDLATGTTVNAVPIPLFSSAGHVATRNPVALEVDGSVLRMYAAPDDGPSDEDPDAVTELLVYEAQL